MIKCCSPTKATKIAVEFNNNNNYNNNSDRMVVFFTVNTLPNVGSAVMQWCTCYVLEKKSSMAGSLPVENLLPQNVESITNYWQ